MPKKLPLILFALLITTQAMTWGNTGHRVVGLIAEKHLTKKARKNIQKILGDETLAEVSTYMDFIRSDHQYDHMAVWHYATIPDEQTYEEAGTPEEGDVIVTINRLIEELKSKNFTDGNEAFALKCLTHLVGDIHQPLHIGKGTDRGGNDFDVSFFWTNSNLHRVWDSGIIDEQQYSYTEYTNWINHVSEDKVELWQQDDIMVWAYESKSYRDQVYDVPDHGRINYEYNFKNLDLVNTRLLQAGIRLAGILNQIYG